MAWRARHPVKRRLQREDVVVDISSLPERPAWNTLAKTQGDIRLEQAGRPEHKLMRLLSEVHVVAVTHGDNGEARRVVVSRDAAELLEVFAVKAPSNCLARPPTRFMRQLLKPARQIIGAAAHSVAPSQLHLGELAAMRQLKPGW